MRLKKFLITDYAWILRKEKKLPHLRHHEVMRIVFTIVAVRALVAEASK